MIGKVLNAIARVISEDIGGRFPAFLNTDIQLGNISQLENMTNFGGKILLSLVNIEQDAPLRNSPNYTPISETEIRYHNPKIVLNLYVLFTALEGASDGAEVRAAELNYLTHIIASLQKKNVFITSDFPINFFLAGDILQTEKIIFDQYTMSFEQQNHLWGTLGGKYLPSIAYKVRLVCIFVNEEGDTARVVESIERKENVIN